MRDPLEALGSRIPARWRIVGWVMFPAVVGVIGLVLAIWSSLHTDAAHQSNEDIVQEIQEFQAFVREGRDPETAQPFASAERMFELYLGRQNPARNELFVARTSPDRYLEIHGSAIPRDYNTLLDDPGIMAQILDGPRAGITDTRFGEIRWGTQSVDFGGRTDPAFAVIAFTQPEADEVNRMARFMLLAAVAVLLLIAAMSWFVAGRILYPVRQVRQTAKLITEQDLTRRIPVTGTDDVADLAVQFNGMLDRLDRAFTTQQRFVDDAGHELRTPITVIRGHLELMSGDPQERRATVELVTTELDRMSRIVSDLLSLATAERPDFVRPAPGTDLGALALDIDAKVQTLGDRRWVLTHVAEGVGAVDPQRITQAVLQLAANAVQHTREGGTVRVGSSFLSRGGRRFIRFTVADDGPGVRAEDAERIFERFARAQHTDPAAVGAGLGLAIVKAIAAGHGGSVHVVPAPGRGATFHLDVPVAGAGRPGEHRKDDHPP